MLAGEKVSIQEAIQYIAESKTVFLFLSDVADEYRWNQVKAITGPYPLDWDIVPIEEDRMWDVHLDSIVYPITTEFGWEIFGNGFYLLD